MAVFFGFSFGFCFFLLYYKGLVNLNFFRGCVLGWFYQYLEVYFGLPCWCIKASFTGCSGILVGA